ncbi:MAG: hypothetical protein AAGI49_01490 [Bacteroidota bacterium]
MSIIFASKFVQILKTFSEAELKAFRLWLRSPWCNSNKNLVTLLASLRKYYPDFDNDELTKELLFKKILPKGKFSDRRMNNLLSEAYLAAERFLIFQHLDQNEDLRKDILSQEWQSRDHESWFFGITRKKIAQLEAKSTKDWEDHLELLQLHRRIYHYPNQKLRMQTGAATIQKMDEELELTYLLEKAAIINEKMSRQSILRGEIYETETEIKRWKAASQTHQHPALDFYKMRFAYTADNRLAHYWKLRKMFFERYQELGEIQQKIHLAALLNDTNLFIRKKLIASTENLPIYKLGLETGSIFYKGKLSYATYTTIIGASNTKKSFDFSLDVIRKYTQHLESSFQMDCEIWAKAHTAYHMGQLEKSLQLLLHHHFSIPYFQLLSRVLNTQVYFDLHLQDDSYQAFLFNYLNTFERWLARDKVWSQSGKKSFLRFVQRCRTLAKYYADPNFSMEKAAELLVEEKNIQSFDWLNHKKDEVIRIKTKRTAFQRKQSQR